MVADEEAKQCQLPYISWKHANSFIQDDQCVKPIRKLGTKLLQVRAQLFGVRLFENMVDEAATGVWANGTEQVAVSISLILHHRRSGILLGLMRFNSDRCPTFELS